MTDETIDVMLKCNRCQIREQMPGFILCQVCWQVCWEKLCNDRPVVPMEP